MQSLLFSVLTNFSAAPLSHSALVFSLLLLDLILTLVPYLLIRPQVILIDANCYRRAVR